jgi:hypothetical protein
MIYPRTALLSLEARVLVSRRPSRLPHLTPSCFVFKLHVNYDYF